MSQLKVISWNIWGGKNLQEIIDCLRETNADIIALQEVLQDEDGKNNNAEEIAKALGYEWVFKSTNTLTPSMSYLLQEQHIESNKQWGNALLSKHPIIENESFILSEKNSRTAIKIVIPFENKNITIFSTHLVHAAHSVEVRLEQVSNLLQLVSNNNTIVAGDFNDIPESESVSNMLNVMYKGADISPTNEDRRIDYIFTTKDIHVIEDGVIHSQASDHLPIYTVITV